MKINQSQKLEIARQHVDEGVPIFELAKKWKYDVGKLKYFCRLYKFYGATEVFEGKESGFYHDVAFALKKR